MSNTLKLIRRKKSAGSSIITYVYQCLLSGSYVNGGAIGTPGETLNFDTATNPNFVSRPKLPRGPSGKTPAASDVRITRIPGGFDAQIEQNATLPTPANFVLRIFTAGSGNAAPVEMSAGTYASNGPALSADTTGLIIEVDVPSKYS